MEENVLFIDWDDTLMPSSYITSAIPHYEIDRDTLKLKSYQFKYESFNSQEFISNLEKTGKAAYDLLTKLCKKYKTTNIKIVTNAVHNWLTDSLIITGSFCKIYQQVANLISNQRIEIVYARDDTLPVVHWKIKCFDQLLYSYLQNKNHTRVNITTIGDQWHDHSSIQHTVCWQMYGKSITHHQVKLFSIPDCRYLCVELKYISELLDGDALAKEKGIVLEFDGYHENQSA